MKKIKKYAIYAFCAIGLFVTVFLVQCGLKAISVTVPASAAVNERVTFDTEAKARQYFAGNVPEVVELNKYRESVGDPDRLLPVLEKRRVVEPGDWLPLEAMTVDPVTGV